MGDVRLTVEPDAQVLDLLNQILEKVTVMTQAMDELVAKVTVMETVEASAVTLLQTLKSELDTALANNDMAAIQELSNRIGTDTDTLAAAVVANTPQVVQVGNV